MFLSIAGRPLVISATLVFVAVLGGCAAIEKSDAMDAERLLTVAGFQMRLADTPEKLAETQKLPQRTLTPQDHEGRTVFVYADAEFCKCLYVGTAEADRRYQRLALVRGLEIQRRETAEAIEGDAMNLDAFGPWYPWY
jgi:hypothetical protein